MPDAIETLLALDGELRTLQSVAGLDELRAQYNTLRACGVIDPHIEFFECLQPPMSGGRRLSERIAECRALLADALQMLGHPP